MNTVGGEVNVNFPYKNDATTKIGDYGANGNRS